VFFFGETAFFFGETAFFFGETAFFFGETLILSLQDLWTPQYNESDFALYLQGSPEAR
jgi:hypothetical protein